MDKQKRNAGITLIALVISIIVMLILAGVSINATVGDNGILKQAQDATYTQSIAILEEFLNQKYISDELKEISELNDDGTEMTPLEKIARKYQDWFYSHGSDDYVLVDYNHIVNGANKTDYLMLHLINKEGLAITEKELAENIKGGDANGNDENAYLNLIDVYGVTDDLKVYYCKDGLVTALGADYANSKVFDSTNVLYQSSSGLAKALAETNGGEPSNLTLQDLRTTTELVITPNSGLQDLSILYDLQSLTKLTLKNYTGSLKGIGSASKLKYLYFENSDGTQKIDYSGIEKANKIKEMYMYMPTDNEVEKLVNSMSNTDYNLLTTFGLYGYMNDNTPTITGEQSSTAKSTFSNVNLINNLSENTKSSIVKMYLNNNKITSNLSLIGFTRLQILRLNCNEITNIKYLPESITSLAINDNLITNDDLGIIAKIKGLSYLYISNNPNLTSIKNISNHVVTGKDYCIDTFIDRDYPIFDAKDTELISTLKKIPHLTLNNKYDLILSNKKEVVIDKSFTEDQVSVLSGNESVTILSIENCKLLSDSFLQNLLSSLPNLTTLNARNSNLESLNFVRSDTYTNRPKITNLDIRDTKVTDLNPINNSYNPVGCLRINIELDMSKYETLTKNLCNRGHATSSTDSFGSRGGLHTSNVKTLQSISKCTFLTNFYFYCSPSLSTNCVVDLSNLNLKNISFSGCSRATFILPKTVTNIDRVEGCQVNASACTNLQNIRITGNISNSSFAENMPSCILKYEVENSSQLATAFIPTVCNEIWLQYSNPWLRPKNIDTTTSITKGTTANFVWLDYVTASNFTTFFSNSNIIRLKLNFCNCTFIPILKNCNSTISLELPNNKISSLKGLENYTALQRLDLSDNITLYNNFSIKDESGTSTTYDTIEYILNNCPSLTYLNLSGIENLKDFSKLEKAGFSDNGSHVFTRSL